jgi:hypothetical protein
MGVGLGCLENYGTVWPAMYSRAVRFDLDGCVTTTTVLHAAARGIRIHRLATELTGDIDLQGFLALDDSVPVGYESIRIRMDIEAGMCSASHPFVRDHRRRRKCSRGFAGRRSASPTRVRRADARDDGGVDVAT